MKVSWVRGLLVLCTFFCLALKKDDIVELEQYFNARYSDNFLKSTNNVKFVMPPGTKGKIGSVKQFNSGNYGLYVELQNGANKGEKVWVYFKAPPQDPGMKLYDANSAEAKSVESAEAMETTQDTPALRAPASEKIPLVVTKEYAAKMLQQMENANKEVRKLETKNVQAPCDDNCRLANATYARDNGIKDPPRAPEKVVVEAKSPAKKVPEKKSTPKETPVEIVKYVEGKSIASPVRRSIPRTENPYKRIGISCGETNESKGLMYCRSLDRNQEEGFQLYNYGDNRIVPKTNNRERYRKFEFSYIGQARQDMHFSVFDSNGTNSQGQESFFMLFPRETLPHARIENGKKIVTLPTGETVSFDMNTNRLTGGVLSEDGASEVGPKPRRAKISYSGQGVMLQAVAMPGKDPRHAVGETTVAITKKGQKCTVSKSELWPDQSGGSALHFKYFSDQDFDSFLRRRCKFGLY